MAEELVPGPVRCRLLEAELLQPVGAVVDPVERHGERKRDDLVVDGHGLPGRRRDVRVMLPGLRARGDVLDRAHAVELADPVVPDLAEIGRTAAGDRADQLLTRLRLRHVFDLHREILLRLIEALDQRIHQRDARRLGNAPLEAHRLGAPGLARADDTGHPTSARSAAAMTPVPASVCSSLRRDSEVRSSMLDPSRWQSLFRLLFAPS